MQMQFLKVGCPRDQLFVGNLNGKLSGYFSVERQCWEIIKHSEIQKKGKAAEGKWGSEKRENVIDVNCFHIHSTGRDAIAMPPKLKRVLS